MTYKQIQQEMKQFKALGLTSIKLNAKKTVLEAEYNKIKKEGKKRIAQNKKRVTQVDFDFLDKCIGATKPRNRMTQSDFDFLGSLL